MLPVDDLAHEREREMSVAETILKFRQNALNCSIDVPDRGVVRHPLQLNHESLVLPGAVERYASARREESTYPS